MVSICPNDKKAHLSLKAFLFGEEHRMYFCIIPVFMNGEKISENVIHWS